MVDEGVVVDGGAVVDEAVVVDGGDGAAGAGNSVAEAATGAGSVGAATPAGSADAPGTSGTVVPSVAVGAATPLVAVVVVASAVALVGVVAGAVGVRWPLTGGDTASNRLVNGVIGSRSVAVIGSVVGQAGSGVAATGWMRTVGLGSWLRWVCVGTWLDVTPRSCQNTQGYPGPGNQQKRSPHCRGVVVVVVGGGGGGRRVVVVVGATVVVVGAADVPVVVVSVVVVVEEEDDGADVEAELLLDAVVAVTVTVRLGGSLRLTTTISPPSLGGSASGDSATAQLDARSAAVAAPIRAPNATRPEPPNAVSIPNDYRPHSFGSNPWGHLVPA